MADPTREHDSAGEARLRVLLVRPSALGDVSRTVPVLASIRRAHPEAQIDWLVARAFADVVRHHPMLNGVITFDRKKLAKFGTSRKATAEGLRLRRELRAAKYDVVYDLQGLFRSGMFTWLTGARRRVGFADARELGWLGCNVRYAVDAVHTVDRMLALVEADGVEPVRDMRLYVGEDDAAWAQRWLSDRGIGESGYACIAPTARWGSKCWPLERYAEIARRLLESGIAGEHLVVLAAPEERTTVEQLAADLPEALRARVHVPTTTVGQLMALLAQTRLLVCNDSAALHIAVGFDRPVVAIFGPTDPATVGPYQRDEAVVRPAEAAQMRGNYRDHLHDATLISGVSVEAVWDKVVAQMPPCSSGATSS